MTRKEQMILNEIVSQATKDFKEASTTPGRDSSVEKAILFALMDVKVSLSLGKKV